MEIGKMNERITIEKNTVVTDAVGNHTNSWTPYFSCFTYASTYAAAESGNEVKQEEETITFSIRYCPETAALTSTGYRVIHRDRIFNIESVDFMNYDHREVRLKCSREVRP